MSVLFPRVGTGRFISLIMELCGGMLLFGAVFFISTPSVMPQRPLARAVWGFAGGIICMIIRYIGAVEESACFGILITCAISDFFDKLPLTKKEKLQIVVEEIVTPELPITVVPDEVLEEIPDIPEEITEETTEEIIEDSVEETPVQEAESLEEVISEENTVTDQQAPFVIGGGEDE